MQSGLSNEFDRIEQLPALRRGQELPILIHRLFEDAGYNARRDAGAARPRDADLYVYSPGEDFLVEVKSGDKPTDIAAISELADRLTRTAPFVIGILISRSRFTKGAIKLV